MEPSRILVTEADDNLVDRFQSLLGVDGDKISFSQDSDAIAHLLKDPSPDLVLACSRKKGIQASLETARRIRRLKPNLPIIFITGYSSEDRAVAAFRAGINDYFKIPFSDRELLTSIHRNLHRSRQNNANASKNGFHSDRHQMIGNSGRMQEVQRQISAVAEADSTVLITGETGTGKELAAMLIHQRSRRRHKPIHCVNCAALPENLVESELFGFERGAFTGAVNRKAGKLAAAAGGSIFLDEIGEMHPYVQAKILRCIETKIVNPLGTSDSIPLDLRFITATNQEPEELVESGRFRKDLFYRLNVARVALPPLRERKEDIPLLVQHAISSLNDRFGRNIRGLTAEALELLMRYDWPGNVRELLNMMEAAYIHMNGAGNSWMDLPDRLCDQMRQSEKLPMRERRRIVDVLQETKWNRSIAAQKLHWSRMTLYRKMVKYNIIEKRTSRTDPT